MNKFKKWEIESIRDSFLKQNLEQRAANDFQDIKNNYNQDSGLSKYAEKFKLVSELMLEFGTETVFIDDHDSSNHIGLISNQISFIGEKPVYLVDNHNQALYPFLEIFRESREMINIVHIDAHRDDAIFPSEVTKIDTKNIQEYLNKTRVSDYLDCGKRGGLIDNIVSVTQSAEFEEFEVPSQPYVLNLDIDIYGPEGQYVDTKLKTETILKAWQNAEAVVFATSPGFISQEDVKALIDIFISNN